MNNSMVAHLWAHEKQEKASGSNFFFEGESIYSFGYHFEVGRIVRNKRGEKAYLLNNKKYNNGCAGIHTEKHKRHAGNAVPTGSIVFYMNELPAHREDTGKMSFVVQCLESIKDAVCRYKKCRTEIHYNSIWFHFRSLMNYIEFYDMGTPKQIMKKNVDHWLGMHHELSWKSDKVKQEYVRELKHIFQIMIKHKGLESFGTVINIVDAVCGEGTYSAYIKRVASYEIKKKKKEDEIFETRRIEQESIFKSLEEKVALWKEGKINSLSMPYFSSEDKPNAYLRISKDKIETSKGIMLSKEEAGRLWELIKMFHEGHPFQHDLVLDASGYKWALNKYENDMLTAGCHRISYMEMEGIAVQLGF